MTAADRKNAIDAYLGPKIDRAKALLERHDLNTARYMAMIVGMWMHAYNLR